MTGITSLQGTINATFDELKAAFGEPYTLCVDYPKTRAAWHGNTFEIYDWKRAERLEELTWRNIGGKNFKSVETVERIIERTRARIANANA